MSQFYVSPYINFGGRAREAMEFYHTVLGGEVDLQAVRLETEGGRIVGTDGHPDYPAKAGENMAIAVGGTDKKRMTAIFDGLAEGGTVKGALAEQPWGGEVGWLMDKFGINWTVSIEKA
jgi:PhnB protein